MHDLNLTNFEENSDILLITINFELYVQITLEKTVLEQASSRYEIQGEYVLPGTRERGPQQSREKERGDGLIELAMAGHLSSVMSSVGRWRLRLEVPFAEVAEMLPLARLFSRSTDPAVRSRSKVLPLSAFYLL